MILAEQIVAAGFRGALDSWGGRQSAADAHDAWAVVEQQDQTGALLEERMGLMLMMLGLVFGVLGISWTSKTQLVFSLLRVEGKTG